MAEIKKLESVLSALRAKAAKATQDNNVSVVVGYTANYAIYVHENLQAQHKDGKQAKFLEQPARELKEEFQRIIFNALKNKKTMAQALLLCGLRLQRESQKICPVDTGNLKASAFTRIEKSGSTIEEHKEPQD